MKLDIQVKSERLKRSIAALSEWNRLPIYTAGANALAEEVGRWIGKASASRHKTAARLGASPTGFLEDASAQVTSQANANEGRAIINAPGFRRAFSPIVVRPVKSKALTIPISAYAYGHRVGDLKANGWNIFRPMKGGGAGPIAARILMGRGPDGAPPAPLYALAASARIPQDRGLLPPDSEMQKTVSNAMLREYLRRVRAVREAS